MPFAGWSPFGIAALLAILSGIGLLVAYAVGRGLVDRELAAIEELAETGTRAPARPAAPGRSSRTLGALGAALLVAGLALGVVSASGGWGTSQASGGPGTAPGDCAQSWGGCPKTTPNP